MWVRENILHTVDIFCKKYHYFKIIYDFLSKLLFFFYVQNKKYLQDSKYLKNTAGNALHSDITRKHICSYTSHFSAKTSHMHIWEKFIKD